MVTRGHSRSLVVTRGHSWSLLDPICLCDGSQTKRNQRSAVAGAEPKNRQQVDLLLTFPIAQQPIRSDMKPQTNYRYWLWFSFLALDWLLLETQ